MLALSDFYLSLQHLQRNSQSIISEAHLRIRYKIADTIASISGNPKCMDNHTLINYEHSNYNGINVCHRMITYWIQLAES